MDENAVVAKIEAELLAETPSETALERAWREGWNDRSRALVTFLTRAEPRPEPRSKTDGLQINVNGRWITIVGESLSYEDVVSLVGGGRSDAGYTVTYTCRPGDARRAGTLAPGDRVDLEDGMVLNATITDRG